MSSDSSIPFAHEKEPSFSQVLRSISAIPTVSEHLSALVPKLETLFAELKQQSRVPAEDRWLDAKAAAEYMSLSLGSFDKYRYATTPRIKGYKLDGKTLYKKSDLDAFIRLYELKSSGLA